MTGKKMKDKETKSNDVTGVLASYIARSGDAELPAAVIREAKHHILDSLTAVVFGSSLRPGRLAIEFIKTQGGVEEAQVAGSSIKTTAINAALANGMMGHAAEIDDYQSTSLTHAGTAVLPAALAVAERENAGGMRLIKAVVAGYDMACRITCAMGIDNFAKLGLSAHSISGTFGAAVAAASILGLNSQQVRYTLSYAVQQASGSLNWIRDEEHVEKAFVFGGMPARNGVTAALFVQMGFPAVFEPFAGGPNYLSFFTRDADLHNLLVEGLGSRFEIMDNIIKKYAVGGPIQAPMDGLLRLRETHRFTADDVEDIVVRLSDEGMRVVNNSNMPNVNLQYNLATALIDGKSVYASTISYERMNHPAVASLRKKIRVIHEPEFDELKKRRFAVVELKLNDGSSLREFVTAVRGSPANPMTTDEVEAKAREFISAVLGVERSQALIEKIRNLEGMKNVRELRQYMAC